MHASSFVHLLFPFLVSAVCANIHILVLLLFYLVSSMRCLHLFLFSCLFLLSNYVCNNPRSIPLSPFISRHTKYLPNVNEKLNIKIDINSYDSLNFLFLGSGFVALLALLYLHLCNYVRYVTFNTNLALRRKRNITSNSPQSMYKNIIITTFDRVALN